MAMAPRTCTLSSGSLPRAARLELLTIRPKPAARIAGTDTRLKQAEDFLFQRAGLIVSDNRWLFALADVRPGDQALAWVDHGNIVRLEP